MKFVGKTGFCLAAWLVLNASLHADDLALNNTSLPNNPYAPIVARNVFNLNPPIADASPEDANPPPKITPNGIMSTFGKVQVLFKVAGTARHGQLAKDQYYTLSAGERQDDIEVMQIDDQNGIITFKNHDVVQILPLASAPANSGTIPSPLPPPTFTPPNNNNGNENSNGRSFGRFGQHSGGQTLRRGQNNQENTGASDDGSDLRTVPTRTYQPEASQMTPEETAIQIEKQRAALLDMPENQRPYTPNILPPTPLTGQY